MIGRAFVAGLILVTTLAAPASAELRPEGWGARPGDPDVSRPLQEALDACASAGGGSVVLGPHTYRSGPVTLATGVHLVLEAGAVLLDNRSPGSDLRPFVSAQGASGVAIEGSGTIDGSGGPWWEAFQARQRAGEGGLTARPRLVMFRDCTDVRVSGVVLRNSPSFHLVPVDCRGVVVEDVTIEAPADSPNTDGIDPSGSQDVVIRRCTIDSGDDNVAIKAGRPGHPSRNVVVEDCRFLHGHGVSIGSETRGGVEDVLVTHCRFQGTVTGIRIKTYRGAGGVVKAIRYADLTMDDVGQAVVVSAYYPKVPAADAAQEVGPGTPELSDIRLDGLRARALKSAGWVVGLPESPVTGVVWTDVSIAAPRGLTVRDASLTAAPDAVKPETGPAFLIEVGGAVSAIPR